MKRSLFLLLLGALGLAGCASTPSLRALNPDEAKIDVYPSGAVTVFGEPIELGDLSSLVRASDTHPEDIVLIRLHGDPDSPALTEMRKYVTDQMIRGGHYKYRFFSTPQASVTTIDPKTGRAETYVSDKPVKILSGDEMAAEVDRMAAERKAYADGSYVSDAAGLKPVKVGNRPDELKLIPQEVDVQTPATPAAKPAPAREQDALREAWKRQQRQRRSTR